MLLDRALYERLVGHCKNVIDQTVPQVSPFPHVLLKGIFPSDVYQLLLESYPSSEHMAKANPKHHSDEYGGSTRKRITLSEAALTALPDSHHKLWATVRAAISSQSIRDSLFSKLSAGLCRRYGIPKDELKTIPAFPRGQLYSETGGFRITPHPDTREKIVTMQFAFPKDDSLVDIGTEFYTRSLNPIYLLREPRGFKISKAMPFLPNHAYAFSVLNDIGMKSWHGRSTIPPMNCVRNSLLHIWYAEADESEKDLIAYRNFLKPVSNLRRTA